MVPWGLHRRGVALGPRTVLRFRTGRRSNYERRLSSTCAALDEGSWRGAASRVDPALDNANAAYIVGILHRMARIGDAAAQARIAAVCQSSRGRRRLCDEFGFDARGRPQLCLITGWRGVRKGLLCLRRRQLRFVRARISSRRRGSEPACGDWGSGGAPVATRADRRIWNTLIAPSIRGITRRLPDLLSRPVGAWHSGAAGFSAAALRLAVRDGWMTATAASGVSQPGGWPEPVPDPSRCRLRARQPCAGARSAAAAGTSRLAMAIVRGWWRRSFLRRGRSLMAANFLRLGLTAGRGRQDVRPGQGCRNGSMSMNWTASGAVTSGLTSSIMRSLRLGEGLSRTDWARNEFGGARLGNRQRSERLVKSASLLAEYPGQAICGNGRSDRAAVDGFYRFIEKAAEHGIDVDAILAPHRERSIQRIAASARCWRSRTEPICFAGRPGCEGLGVIGRNQAPRRPACICMRHLGDRQLPLGVLRCEFEAPPGGRKKPGQVPKSHRWLRGFDDTLVAADGLTGRTRVIAVMDREADCFLLFDHQRRHRRVDLLVRAKHDRCLDKSTKLFAALRSKPVAGTIDIRPHHAETEIRQGHPGGPWRGAAWGYHQGGPASDPAGRTGDRDRPTGGRGPGQVDLAHQLAGGRRRGCPRGDRLLSDGKSRTISGSSSPDAGSSILPSVPRTG